MTSLARIRRTLVIGVAALALFAAIPSTPAQALDYIWHGDRSKTGQVTDYGPSVFFSGDLYGDDPLVPKYPEPGYLIRERVAVFINRDAGWKTVDAADTFVGGPNDRFSGWSGPGQVANSSDYCSYAVNSYAWFQYPGYVQVIMTSTTCSGTIHDAFRY